MKGLRIFNPTIVLLRSMIYSFVRASIQDFISMVSLSSFKSVRIFNPTVILLLQLISPSVIATIHNFISATCLDYELSKSLRIVQPYGDSATLIEIYLHEFNY